MMTLSGQSIKSRKLLMESLKREILSAVCRNTTEKCRRKFLYRICDRYYKNVSKTVDIQTHAKAEKPYVAAVYYKVRGCGV